MEVERLHNPGAAKAERVFSEIVRMALDSFRDHKVRFVLTALGMVIGTASLILVVTVGLTGKTYVLNQIQAIGANLIYAYYEGGSNASVSTVPGDFLTVEDMRAVENQVPGIVAASPMVEIHERIPVGGGMERDVLVLGVDPQYQQVRNLEVLAGRFFDDQDSMARSKVVCITQKLAQRLYGGQDAAVGQTIKLSGLPFTVAGTFRERVETFGQSEVAEDTIVLPYTVSRYFTGTDAVKQIFFSVASAGDVPRATAEIQEVIKQRHRPESVYHVENLTELLAVANKTASALTLVLLGIAMITLLVSGVGIMNIMLATVTARTREIGIRKAVGATSRDIRFQFLAEAVFISVCGGLVGTLIGLALPFSVRFFTSFRIPISGLSAIIAILVSSLVGIVFGTVPAALAAKQDPVVSLHYE